MKMINRMRLQLGALLASGLLALAAALPSAITTLGPPAAAVAIGAAALVPSSAQAALTFSTSVKSDILTAVLPSLNGGTIKLYNGTKPSALGSPTGTLLATLTMSNPAGTVSSGVFTLGSVTQTNSSHVNGTPTFVRISTSGGTVVADIDIGSGAGNLQFTGSVTTGQNVTLTGVTFTAGN